MSALINPPSLVTYGALRFLIVDSPSDLNIEAYVKEFKTNNVTDVVRACEPSYRVDRLEKAGIHVHEMPFTDGVPPPEDIIDRFLALCKERFAKGNPDNNAIAVHCVAGLGRAPVLVALAIMDAGVDALEAVEMIRTKRRGAINTRQLRFLEHEYKKKSGPCVVQ